MSLLIGFLTVVLVLTCLLLILLVIIQLPKKEAGLGIAFGGAAADALFGPGSGTILTRMTKYSTILFFVTTILLTSLYMKAAKRERLELLKNPTIQEPTSTTPNTTTPAIPSAPELPANQAQPQTENQTPSETK